MEVYPQSSVYRSISHEVNQPFSGTPHDYWATGQNRWQSVWIIPFGLKIANDWNKPRQKDNITTSILSTSHLFPFLWTRDAHQPIFPSGYKSASAVPHIFAGENGKVKVPLLLLERVILVGHVQHIVWVTSLLPLARDYGMACGFPGFDLHPIHSLKSLVFPRLFMGINGG